MSRPRVLLLLATTSYRADDFLEAAEALGADVVVGTDHEPVLSGLAPGTTLFLSFDDLDGSLQRIRAAHGEAPFDAVVAAEDQGVLLGAAAGRALGLPHNPPDAARSARDKLRFRERMAAADIPTPAFRALELDGDPVEVGRGMSFPRVLKPRSLSASQGVIRADDEEELLQAFGRVGCIVRDSDPGRRSAVRGPELMVEEYVPGVEVAVEALLDEGRLHVLALFDKPDPLEGPYFEETLFVTPSRLPASRREEIVETTRRVAAALGLRHGPLHAEMRVNDRGVWPLEVAPRSIGGRCARVLRFGSGLSLEELILRQAAGLDVPSWKREEGAAGVMMLPVPGRGTLTGVGGREEALSVDGVEGLDVTIPLGQEVVPLPEGNRYLGFLFARAETPEEVERALREAHALLDVEVEPVGSTETSDPTLREAVR